MKIRIGRLLWELVRPQPVVFADTPYGECDDPKTPGKQIRVRADLTDKLELDTLIHEMLHASAWEVLSEEFVTQTAHDVARVLWRLGYRKIDEDPDEADSDSALQGDANAGE